MKKSLTIFSLLFLSGLGLFPLAALGVVVAGDLVCTRCVGTTDLADNGVTSAKILNGTILNADINAAAAIDPTKILGTAWTASNDGSASGLDADLLDGVDSLVFLRNDTSGTINGTLNVNELQVSPSTLSLEKILLYDGEMATNYTIGVETGGGLVYNVDVGDSAHFQDFRFNNSTALRITGEGKVGIGTTSPSARLDLASTSDTGGELRIDGRFNGTGPAVKVLADTRTGEENLIEIDNNGGGAGLYMQAGGNIGIGTASPSEKLNVQGNIIATGTICGSAGCVGSTSGGVTGSGTAGRLAKWDTGGTSLAGTSMYISSDRLGVNTGGDPKIDLAVGDDDTGLEEVSDGKLAVYTNNTERLRISSDGNIGIGDTSPSSDLTIARDDTTSEGGELRLNGSGGAYNYLYIDNYKGKARIVTNDGSTDHVALTADASGYVGIGTSDPLYGLDVHAVGSAHQAIHATMNDPATTANPFTIYADNYSTGDSTGSPVAVYGEEYATSPATGGAFGVLGRTHSTSASGGSSSAGVWGGASGNDDTTHGSHNGIANGIQGETWSTNNSAAGGRFYANTSTSGKAEAVYGYTDSTDTSSFSFEGHGPTVTTGTKSAAVYTDRQGPTELFTEESAGVWFSDYGTGQLANGRLTVEIDPVFLQTVTIDDTHPLEVFVQAYDPAQLYVKPGQTSFEVLAVNDNASTAKFSYRIVAKRKYYEDVRLQPVEVSVDQFMRPDLNWDLIDALNAHWGLPSADPRQPTGPKMIPNP